jgi:hypothetical protein
LERIEAMNAVINAWTDRVPTRTPAGDDMRASEAWDAWVEPLVDLLKSPASRLIHMISERPAPSAATPDWASIAVQLRHTFNRNEVSSREAYVRLRLALGVLWMQQVPICQGPAGIRFYEDDCLDAHVLVTLHVDVDPRRAYDLGGELRTLASACDACVLGFLVLFQPIHPAPPSPRLQRSEDDGELDAPDADDRQ